MRDANATILLIGYGNPGRADDGLGPALAERIAALNIDGVSVDSAYQLQMEDAAAIAEHDIVVFADAETSPAEAVTFRPVEPRPDASFTSHSVSPSALLAAAHDLFSASTRGFVLGIRGHVFDVFEERLSARAEADLAAAVQFITPLLRGRSFPDRIAPVHCAPDVSRRMTDDA